MDITKGVTARDIKYMFDGLSVTVTKKAKGLWRVYVDKQQGAYYAIRYAQRVPQSYPGHSVELIIG